MKRSKGRMLAVMLAATTVLSSVLPGAVMAAEPVDADTSVNAVAETAAETEPGDVQESAVTDEAPAEGSGADEAETLEGQREEEAVEGPATGSSEADPSEEPGNAGTDDTTAQEAEPENEPDKETADKDEERPIGRFAIRFDSEGGVVKVIMSSDVREPPRMILPISWKRKTAMASPLPRETGGPIVLTRQKRGLSLILKRTMERKSL